MNSWIFGKINKKDKSLDELIKRLTQINKIRDKRGMSTTDTQIPMKFMGFFFRKEIGEFQDFTRKRKTLGLISTFRKVTKCKQKIHSIFIY